MIAIAKSHLRLFAILFLGAAGCQSAVAERPTTVASTASSTDIGSHRTFAFGFSEMAPSGYKSSSRSFEAQRRARDMISTVLVQKGYVEDAKSPDILVRFGVSNARVIENVESEAAEASESTDLGRLEIDAYDAATKLQIWSAVVVMQVNPRAIDNRIVAEAVAQAMASFPMRVAAAEASVPVAGATSLQSAD